MQRLLRIQLVFALLIGNLAWSECGVLSKLYKRSDQSYKDDFTTEDSNTNFWAHHERHGVYRRGDQFILGAKTKQKAKNRAKELAKYFGVPADDVVPVKTDNDSGYFLDVSSLIPAHLGQHLDRRSFASSNCYGFCTFGNLSAAGYSFDPSDLSHILRAPLAQPIKMKDIQPGDVVLMRDTTAEPGKSSITNINHALQYISPSLALSKNGYSREAPFRIMDMDESIGPYYSARERVAEVYRLPDMETVKAKYGKSHRQLVSEIAKLYEMEKAIAPLLIREHIESLTEAQKKKARKEFKAVVEYASELDGKYLDEYFQNLDFGGLKYKTPWKSRSKKETDPTPTACSA